VWQSFWSSEDFASDNSSGSHCHEEIDLHPKPKGDTKTLDETTRFRITNKFVGILGEEDAAKLMDSIPPIDWDRFATKDDIAAATILTKAEMELEFANFRTEVAVQFAEVRSEFATQFAEVRTEIADVRTEMRTEFADVRTDMNNRFAEVQLSFAKVDVKFAETDAKMQKAFRTQTLTMVSFLFTANALMVSLVTWLR
jgi:hypothetical protein